MTTEDVIVAEEDVKDEVSSTSEESAGQEEIAEPEEEEKEEKEDAEQQDKSTKEEKEFVKPRRSKARERIQELVAKNKITREENERLKAELEAMKIPDIGNAPNEEDFDTMEDYQAAIDSYSEKSLEAKIDSKLKERQLKDIEFRNTQFAQEVEKVFYENVNEIAKERPADFESKIEELKTIPIFTEFMRDFVMQSENGADMAYFFHANQDYARQIAQMSPVHASRELVALENKVKVDLKTKKVSNAPDPISPVGNSGGILNKDPEKMTDEEWDKWRAKTKKIL